jgi:integrative and conjugative element protein (TIGR02256 family)
MSRLLGVVVDGGAAHIGLDPAVVGTFRSWRQGRFAPEACGILLGMQWPTRWEVTEATPPQLGDRRRQHSYVRETPDHMEIAMSRWEQSGGLIGYLGEWHTHPESHASPSSRDLAELCKISQRNRTLTLSIVVGHKTCSAAFARGGRVTHVRRFEI